MDIKTLQALAGIVSKETVEENIPKDRLEKYLSKPKPKTYDTRSLSDDDLERIEKSADDDDAELAEKAPPGMESWIKDRKEGFKKQYGNDWESVLYATAWDQYNSKNESVSEEDADPLDMEVEDKAALAYAYREFASGQLDLEDYMDKYEYRSKMDAQNTLRLGKQYNSEMFSAISDDELLGMSTGINDYTESVTEEVVGDIKNGYGDDHEADPEDYFPTGAVQNLVKNVGPSGSRHGDNPMQKNMREKDAEDLEESAKIHKDLVYAYRNFLSEDN